MVCCGILLILLLYEIFSMCSLVYSVSWLKILLLRWLLVKYRFCRDVVKVLLYFVVKLEFFCVVGGGGVFFDEVMEFCVVVLEMIDVLCLFLL